MNSLLVLPRNEDPRIRGFPLGIGYLAAALEKAGHNIECLDENYSKIKDSLNIDFFGVSITSPTYRQGLKIIEKVKRENPDCITAVGGPHATVAGETILRYHPEVDYVFVGESEKSLVDFANGFDNGVLPQRMLIRQDSFIEDLSAVSHPFRFGDYDISLFPEKTSQMITARGCLYGCGFCSSCSIWGKKHRRRGIDDVISELQELKAMGYRGTFFEDDEFILKSKKSRQWVIDFSEGVQGLNMKFGCGTRVDSIDEEAVSAMANAGFKLNYFGLETGNQNLLDAIQKGTTIGQAEEAVRITKSAGIHTHGSFIIGLPGETKDTIKRTMGWINKIELDSWTFSILSLYPRSPLARKYGVNAESYENPILESPMRKLVSEFGCVHGIGAIYPPYLDPGLIEWWFDEYQEVIEKQGTCHKKLEVK